ncbi:MAG: lytic murein transglycosylase B [Myxococcales bacterium]|nr:lytic murein transglycosylase B [Myxococcales bacterium]
MIALLCAAALAAPSVQTHDPAHVAEVAAAAGLDVATVEQHLAELERDDTVLERLAKPWEAKPWHEYGALFLTEERIAKGRAFRDTHAELLARAQSTYGVPASIVLAFLGVETRFGEVMGDDSIATALYTLGFHHERRGKFFRKELGHFLRLATDQGWSIPERKGSYAGAMGMGQFMPSSYQKYGVDFDDDGTIDLFTPADAIGSIAYYVAMHGWLRGEPILVEATVEGDAADLAKKSGLRLNSTVDGLRKAGVTLSEDIDGKARARLFHFDGAEAPEYRVGLRNFYVITRYNRSTLYARAVTELSARF